jgi:hypothetical protein
MFPPASCWCCTRWGRTHMIHFLIFLLVVCLVVGTLPLWWS